MSERPEISGRSLSDSGSGGGRSDSLPSLPFAGYLSPWGSSSSLGGPATVHESAIQVETPRRGSTNRISTTQPTTTRPMTMIPPDPLRIPTALSPYAHGKESTLTSCPPEAKCGSPRLLVRDASGPGRAARRGSRIRRAPAMPISLAQAKDRPPLLDLLGAAVGTHHFGARAHRTHVLLELRMAHLASVLINRHGPPPPQTGARDTHELDILCAPRYHPCIANTPLGYEAHSTR